MNLIDWARIEGVILLRRWGDFLMAKEHKKLYKAGKNWLVATLFAVAAGTALATASVHADTTEQSQPVVTDALTSQPAVNVTATAQ